jgi:hypothetical protein
VTKERENEYGPQQEDNSLQQQGGVPVAAAAREFAPSNRPGGVAAGCGASAHQVSEG